MEHRLDFDGQGLLVVYQTRSRGPKVQAIVDEATGTSIPLDSSLGKKATRRFANPIKERIVAERVEAVRFTSETGRRARMDQLIYPS
ncbi:MAG: hypothetical protein Q8P97_01010 [bacterium]|nr:hypothetical protein [bacterium]